MSDVNWNKFIVDGFFEEGCSQKTVMVKSDSFVDDDFNPDGILFGTLINDSDGITLYTSIWDGVNDCYKGITIKEYMYGGLLYGSLFYISDITEIVVVKSYQMA